ncbi:GMC family oxidoreductase N-terminal domain-containing protein [Rhizobium sp. CNPSo 4062]|uniref:GMC family oxidoreductase n=1 Tax=Rhizobium sp. CNPSo 4062 TaxID=3021410 RepID=UPI00254D9164|nr:GMC family oxidoreductase N-terminal domain-containing protein [Rhizobium sp. CNPSo 4062]MDK4704011.1 GMC family oxidoreductase N-terminal domain-containing protein [Rhizobium sp. CNPSo 4062]
MPDFDYIIVGGGAAGCVLANRLSEDPATRVCLVEAGMDRNARKAIVRIPLAMVTFMAPALAFLGGPKFMSWFETEPEPGLQGRSIALPRGKGMGGSTNVNGQIFIRGQREDFDHWRDLGNPGWGYDDLLPYFRKLERFEILAEPGSAGHIRFGNAPLEKQIDPTYHGTKGPLNIAPLRSVNPMAEVFLEAAQQAGYPLNADFNGARQNGVGLYTFTQKNGERVTAEGAYLDPVRHRPNLMVMSETEVTRVVFDGRKATGIAFRRNGENGMLDGREIILSSGSFVSPHLLMLSGIGSAKELARHGIPVIADLPGVGENLQDHLDVTIEYRAKSIAPYGVSWRALPRNVGHVLNWVFNKRGLFSSTTGEGGGFISTDPESDRPDIQLFFCTGRANTQAASGFTGHGFLMHVCQLRPGSIGRVALKSADPNEKPSILYNFFRGDSTMDVLRKGVRLARQITAQAPFKSHLDAEIDPGPDIESDGALDAFIRERVGTLFHPVGTCAMGRGERSVVDPATMRVHGVEGLRVVDASIMPGIVSANTVAATYCLAEKAADLIRATDANSILT